MIVISTHLLGRDLVGGGPHVDLLVRVHAGDDEEHPRASRPARQQPPQPEDDRPFVLLVQNAKSACIGYTWYRDGRTGGRHQYMLHRLRLQAIAENNLLFIW